jgi:pimeloyl-ACP methyl ester carboxylesterase
VSATDVVFRADALTLAIRDYGGTGHPIVLVHGAGANLITWDLIAPLLTRYGRVVAFDQRGHGCSDGTLDYAPATLAGDLGALGLDRPIVVGHSWGATVAVEYAATAGCRGVVNIDGNVGSPADVFAGTEIAAPQPEGGTPAVRSWADGELAVMADAQVALRSAQGGRHIGELEVATVARNLRRDADGRSHLRPSPAEERARRRAAWHHDLSVRYRQLRCPVAFVMSEETRLGAANPRTPLASEAVRRHLERLVEARPDFLVRWVPGGHNIPLAQPEQLGAIVGQFVATVTWSDHPSQSQ